MAGLRARVSEYNTRYERALARVKTYPQIEAEAAQLNRDYGIHKKNYEDLVTRREAAAMSGDLEVASGNADFRLIDPPRVSAKPVWPNRLLLMPLVLLVALGAGLFLPFAASQLRPAFHHSNELRNKIALPLLGVVSLVMSEVDAQREKANRVRFWVASSALFGFFAVGLTAMAVLANR